MSNIFNLLYTMLAQTGPPAAAQDAQQAAQVTGMRWDGWLMLIFGIALLYGGLAYCLWLAAGRSRPETWTEGDDEEECDAPVIVGK
jgi:hypothetical protein